MMWLPLSPELVSLTPPAVIVMLLLSPCNHCLVVVLPTPYHPCPHSLPAVIALHVHPESSRLRWWLWVLLRLHLHTYDLLLLFLYIYF